MRKVFIAITLVLLQQVLAITCLFTTCHAEPGRRPIKKKMNTHFDILQNADSPIYDFRLGASIDKMLSQGSDTDLYDPMTIENLKRLKEEAQPQLNPDDIDPLRTRTVVEQALALQSGQSVINLIKTSDLRETYLAIKRGFLNFQDAVRYKVQRDSSGFQVSREKKGKSLIEFNVEFNAHTVLDPQLRIGEVVRFRYDYGDKAPVLEYHYQF